MDRGVEQTGVVLEDVLGAVAVMHVEIDHRNAADAMDLARLLRPDGDIVEQAEAHGLGDLGVVAGRAGGAEGIARFPRHDSIDRSTDGAGGAQGGLAGTGRQDRVVVQFDMAFPRDRGKHALDVGDGMDSGQLFDLGAGRHPAIEEMEGLTLKRRQHGLQPLGAFRMSDAGIVLDAGGMAEKGGIHAASSFSVRFPACRSERPTVTAYPAWPPEELPRERACVLDLIISYCRMSRRNYSRG